MILNVKLQCKKKNIIIKENWNKKIINWEKNQKNENKKIK